MSKVTLNNLTDLSNQNTVVTTINTNNSTITTAFDDTLSRSGITPNQMNSPLDMNSNRIINLPAPASLQDPVRLIELQNAQFPGGSPTPPISSTNVTTFNSRTAAVASTVSASVSFIITGGYASSGDGGAATYYRVGGSTTGGFQSADTAWWAIADRAVNIIQFGASSGQSNAAVTTTAFNNAVSYQLSRGGGIIYVPQGSWYLNSMITMGSGSGSILLTGLGQQECAITANNVDISLFKIQTPYTVIKDLTLQGYNNVAATTPTIWLSSGSVGSRIEHCSIYYGLEGVLQDTGDSVIEDCFVTCAFNSLVRVNSANAGGGQIWLRRSKLDQAWPTVAPAYGTSIPAWTAGGIGAVRTINDVVTVVQTVNTVPTTFYLQCTQGGVSTAQPVVVGYTFDTSTDIVEAGGSVKWRLALQAGYVGFSADRNAFEIHCEQCDFNGSFANSVQMFNSSASSGATSTYPASLFIHDSVLGGPPLNSQINAAHGSHLVVKGCEIAGCVLNPSNCIVFGTTYGGGAVIEGNVFYGGNSALAPIKATNGIQIASGSSYLIHNNYIGQMDTNGILVGSNISGFSVLGNSFSNNATNVRIGSGCDSFIVESNLNGGGAYVNGTSSASTRVITNNV